MRFLAIVSLAVCMGAPAAQGRMFPLESADEEQAVEQGAAESPEIATDAISNEYAAGCDQCDDECSSCGGCCSSLLSYTGGCPCGEWDGCGCPNDRLFGLIARSDYCFNDFISPISNPLFFEDPRQLSEVRFIYAHHNIPDGTPVLQGGDVNYYAMQARARLTDRISFIATKDGYIDIDTPGADTPKAGPTWPRGSSSRSFAIRSVSSCCRPA